MSAEPHGRALEQQADAPTVRPGKRKYTSKACEECRRRRAKCDGNKPACSRCKGRGIECRFRFEEDGRRPAPKSYVQLLRNRIDVLERILQSHGIDVDAAVAQAAAEDSSAEQGGSPHLPTSLDSQAGSSSSQFEELCAAFEGALSLDESLNFDQDGEIRYFGPTSGRLEFQHSGPSGSGSSTEAQADKLRCIPANLRHPHLPQASERETGLPDALKAELVDLYFAWEQPWFQVINEELFRESERTNGRYSSPLLLNCILGIGARFSDRPELRTDPDDPNTAGKCFLEKAEVLLQYDLKGPSITTIQALCLMGTLYFAFGSDAPGWLHHGIANRLALDLGLNLDSAALAGSHLMPKEEIDLRRQIYWAMYIHDKLAAAYTGRVCTMLDSQGSVKIPSNSMPHQTALISLCQICEKIMNNLYAPKPSLSGLQKIPFLSSCILELKTWFYDLPSGLRIDRPARGDIPPQIFTTHMVYHTIFILLVTPFFSKPRPQAAGAESDVITIKATAICYEASRQMILVARRYRQMYGSFRRSPISATHCTLSAALVLLRMAKRNGGETSPRDTRMIDDCLQVLDELSVSWNIAKRIRESLVRLYHQLRVASESSIPTLESPHTDSEQSISDASMRTEMLPPPHEGLPQVFPGQPASQMQASLGLPEFPEEMLLDDSLWANQSLDFTLDSLSSDYSSFDMLGRWQFHEAQQQHQHHHHHQM